MSERTITQQALGKRIEKLTPTDLTKYFKTPKKESDRKEFKAYLDNPKAGEGGIDAVLRTICAFLNSEGGLLIWGAPIGKSPTQGQEKEFHGSLTHVVNDYGDDQLSDMVFDRISPPPQDIRIKKLMHRGHRAYVFEVPRSPYAPHQVKEKGAYWFRFNATTKPAPHHFVEALMRKVSYPDIAPYLRRATLQQIEKKIIVSLEILIVNHSTLQNEVDISLFATTTQGQFTGIGSFQGPNTDYLNNQREIRKRGIADILHYGIIKWERLSIELPTSSIGNEFRLVVSIAGRSSPVKASSYFIPVTLAGQETQSEFRIERENYDFHSTIGDMTSSNSALLEEALGRNPKQLSR
jgi:Putative DNA-binding domain